MLQKSRRERIFIWGKTRPELSKTYNELVCTGGILEGTGEMIRIYPVPLRFLDDEQKFSKYQWIEASIEKSSKDTRPESYQIDFNDITVKEKIGTDGDGWDRRAAIIFHEKTVVRSVEDLMKQQAATKRSLGVLKPKEVVSIDCEAVPFEEKSEWKKRYDAIQQKQMFPSLQAEMREVTPLPPPDYIYRMKFFCDDPECVKPHNCRVLDWEIDALYKNLVTRKGLPKNLAAAQVTENLENIARSEYDLKLFMGNMASHPTRFTIVGLWRPQKSKLEESRMPLFAGVE